MQQERAKGPVLLVDSGNALFKAPGLTSAPDRERAAFILKSMGQLGTAAMAAGARDLDLGPRWLMSQAEKSNVRVLSVNLVDRSGKPIFAPSSVAEIGGQKIALIGVSPVGPVAHGDGAKGLSAPAAVAREAKKLRHDVDLVVVLAALPYADALQLATEVGGAVDLIIQSHEGRGASIAQHGDNNFVLPSGERGRQLGRLVLTVEGKGPIIDAQELRRDEQTLTILESQIAEVKKRQQLASDPAARQALAETRRQFVTRQKDVSARLEAARKAGGRIMTLDWMPLTSEFTEDAAIAAGARKLEPDGATH